MSAPFDPHRPYGPHNPYRSLDPSTLDPSTLDPHRTAGPSRSTAGVVTLAVVGGFGALLALVGALTSGAGGALVVVGLTLLVLGLGSVLVGRSWWALLASRRLGGGVLAAGLVLLVVGGTLLPTPEPPPAADLTAPSSSATPTTTVTPTTPADPVVALVGGASNGSALAALGTLEVKGRAPRTGYDRDVFGQAWADVDRNGCDTRNDVLARDLTAATVARGTQGCLVLSGTLADPYTATSIAFVRGEGTSEAVQVDHVVALSDAWQKGAQGWDLTTRTAFANDPLNLLATGGPTNAAKGDGDAATWLPPSTAFRCEYVARQVSVKAKYRLWVTDAERAAVARVLSGCADEVVVTDAAAAGEGAAHQQAAREADARAVAAQRSTATPRASAPAPTTQVAPVRTTPAPVAPPAAAPGDVYYKNCTEARAAGAAPVHRGDPGYSSTLDRDGDGIGCE
jgi:hypothetical protein